VDKVLNLSAFGDVIEKPGTAGGDYTFNSFRKTMSDMPENGNMDKVNFLTHSVLKNTAQIKLLHWQTRSFSEHKALDELFNTFISLTDDLVESAMGKYCRPELSDKECTMSVMNYMNPDSPDGLNSYMKAVYKCYAVDCKALFDKDPEILNQLDEILSLLDKINYLLTLKR